MILVPSILELSYTSWDIKAVTDDLWHDADEALRREILRQWQENRAVTGGHVWRVPAWAGAYPEIHWHSPMERSGWSEEELLQYDAGCPLPPFKWDEERRARLKAELDAYYALLYGLTRDELRYILDPQEVYGDDFPGETFRVLKEKEIKKYGEYRTRRLVLEAYDRLAPSWDMETHLKKLKEVWEKYQVDRSKKPPKKLETPPEEEPLPRAAEPSAGEQLYKDPRLFDEPNLFNQPREKKTKKNEK